MDTEKEFNTDKAIKAQNDLIAKNGYPAFPPSNGNCFNCRRQIYAPVWWVIKDGYRNIEVKKDEAEFLTGIDVEKASKELVTGCPHCNRSYCS